MELLHELVAIILFIILVQASYSQHEDIPYEPIEKICQKCVCLTARDDNQRTNVHHILSCAERKLKHILPRWPEEFGTNHTGIEIIATFSRNLIPLLQQIPPTKAKLSFSCRHCGLKDIQSPTFVDVPNILRLDLSWNYLSEDVLTPDVFRGPYNSRAYEPIALEELDVSHNYIRTLDRNIFEHTPQLKILSFAHNQFDVIDVSTAVAIGSVTNLQRLDLSYNELGNLPSNLFQPHKNLQELFLQGNQLNILPDGLGFVGQGLHYMNLGNNPIKQINESNFSSLRGLTYLNISGMYELEVIEYGALTRLNKLQTLICNNNPKLERFDITSLRNSSDLEILDISNNNLTTLLITTDHLLDASLPTWNKLHSFHIEGNPWYCDCFLLKILQNYKSKLENKDVYGRCDAPYDLAGSILHELNPEEICQIPIARKLKIPIHDPPSFLKPRSIALSIISITIVIAIGIVIGFGIAVVKKKLQKSELIFTTPIRYTIVRNTPTE